MFFPLVACLSKCGRLFHQVRKVYGESVLAFSKLAESSKQQQIRIAFNLFLLPVDDLKLYQTNYSPNYYLK